MLVADPSSACDVCLEAFSSSRECWCIVPCGHIFCRECLNRLTQTICPVCRASLGNPDASPIKVHGVDFSKCPSGSKVDGPDARSEVDGPDAKSEVDRDGPDLRQLVNSSQVEALRRRLVALKMWRRLRRDVVLN
ncbi:hypothetical protein JB92DRAFT_2934442 [Gautieria morchelliformis]|nr:hypothetical protein JB92DRAFT_2934442 [Gautieria morchelliformis]